jgi:riboflavin biosynthesis pyrimidine reductase
MTTSIDGKVTGKFLSHPASATATEVYYEINREYKKKGSGGFICGRVTMEESFTGGFYPDLSHYDPVQAKEACWFASDATYFAIAFDPKGKLGWKTNVIEDSDEGYGGAHIVEVLSEQADPRYLAYLQEKRISYFFAGEREINVPLALQTLHEHLSPTFYLLEGGSIINGHFLRADCVDELSLVQAPVVADAADKPLFADVAPRGFVLREARAEDGALVMRYTKDHEKIV